MKYPCLKFGNEQDFERAKIELEWIATRRKLRQKDFERVSEKYILPIDFLKKGIEGLDLDDCLITRSKWFPIMYSWRFEAIEVERDFVKLCIDYVRSRFFGRRFLFYTFVILSYLSFYFAVFLNTPILEVMWTLIIPVLLFAFEIFFELKVKAAEKKSKRDEFARQMILRGFGQNVDSTIKFVDKQWKVAVIDPQKLIDAPTLTLFPMEKLKGEDFQEIKRRMPEEKSSYPQFYGENPHQAYKQRIDALRRQRNEE